MTCGVGRYALWFGRLIGLVIKQGYHVWHDVRIDRPKSECTVVTYHLHTSGNYMYIFIYYRKFVVRSINLLFQFGIKRKCLKNGRGR